MSAALHGAALPGLTDGVQARPLAQRHLAGLLAVQRACYGGALVESLEVFARRLASPAQCSLVLEQAGQVVAYLAAYRSQLGQVTPLHGDFESVAAPALANALYVHDLAVLPQWAGRGLARALLAPMWAQARAQGLGHTALVSVQGSQAYWEHQGYAVQPLAPGLQRARLAAYGAGALYMARALHPGGAWAAGPARP